MIIIKNGERQIYHPRNPNLILVNPKLTLEDNGAGRLTFKVYDSNLNYQTIKKLYPLISVIRDGEILFKGRVISDKKDFCNGKTVEAEGKLAFLNDSYMEPFSFSGSPEELFRKIIENHNSQVMEWQEFKAGIVTVADANDYIVRGSENVLNSWNALKDKCFKSSLGGHIRMRYEADGDYIDWLSDYDTVSKQSIEFARNMIDMSSERDATETYTAIRPIGAEVEGTKIDVSSVNNGKTYIVNEEKAAEYGIIYAPESESTWEDVTLPENLLKKAKEKLYGSFVTMKETYEIKAVDLNLTDPDIEALNICEYVPVVSRPHGINGRYLLSKAQICIAEPQNSIFYLGSSKRVLGDMSMGGGTPVAVPKNISSFKNDAGYISEEKTEELLLDYSKTEEVEEIVNQAVSQIPSGADGADGKDGVDGQNGLSAYEIAVNNGFTGDESEWLESLKGMKGEDGADGQDGLSAYEIAVNNGFTGDESEWLESLKGMKGKDGADGADGQNGLSAYEIAVNNGFTGDESEWLESLKGMKGKDGADGADGQNGLSVYEIAVNNGFTGDESEWLESLKGMKGEDGADGQDGRTPTIGENGNWFIGDEDTGMPSRGEKGDKGDPGSSGGDVLSFNERTGAIMPETGDYTAEMVGAATIEQVNAAIQTAVLESWGKDY